MRTFTVLNKMFLCFRLVIKRKSRCYMMAWRLRTIVPYTTEPSQRYLWILKTTSSERVHLSVLFVYSIFCSPLCFYVHFLKLNKSNSRLKQVHLYWRRQRWLSIRTLGRSLFFLLLLHDHLWWHQNFRVKVSGHHKQTGFLLGTALKVQSFYLWWWRVRRC
jgi:hypothetical protein